MLHCVKISFIFHFWLALSRVGQLSLLDSARNELWDQLRQGQGKLVYMLGFNCQHGVSDWIVCWSVLCHTCIVYLLHWLNLHARYHLSPCLNIEKQFSVGVECKNESFCTVTYNLSCGLLYCHIFSNMLFSKRATAYLWYLMTWKQISLVNHTGFLIALYSNIVKLNSVHREHSNITFCSFWF